MFLHFFFLRSFQFMAYVLLFSWYERVQKDIKEFGITPSHWRLLLLIA